MPPVDNSTTPEWETITYRFTPVSSDVVVVPLRFDRRTYRLQVSAADPPPDWTRLDCHRCSNCTLDAAVVASCPTALGLAAFLPSFTATHSYDKAVVQVETPNRTMTADTTMQAGLASLMGLVSATSGCPHTRFLRPMARLHLPFADERETLIRSFSSWLLTAYMAQRLSGRHLPPSLDGLKLHYEKISTVNAHLAQRLRTVATRDATLNAIIILDVFAQIAPANIDGDMEDILDCLVIEE